MKINLKIAGHKDNICFGIGFRIINTAASI